MLNGTVVEGRTADTDQLVFTVSVDAAGVVTLDQLRAVEHPATTNPDDAVTLSAANLITLTGTVTDGDGDSASAVLSIGQNLSFEDDGPLVSPNLPVQLDDDALTGGIAGGDGDVDPDAANTSGTLAHSYGADGAGTTLLTGAGGVLPTGFTAAVSVDGLTLTISQGAVPVLQVQLTDATSGAYTVTQLAAIDHPVAGTEDNLQFTVNYEATDGDGDTATGSLLIDVDDDTPTISTTGTGPTLTVDETNLATNASANFAAAFTAAFGADGPGTISLALGVVSGASGLVDTATGEAVNLVLNGTVVEGRTADADQIVFTVSVDAAGVVTLDQLRAVEHPATTNPDDAVTLSAANLITLTGTVTDGDGDSASAVLSIGQNLSFEDDGPLVSPNLPVQLDDDALTGGIAGGAGDVAPDTANTSGTLAHSYGADGAGTTLLTRAGGVLPTGFTAAVSVDGLTLTISQGAVPVLQVQLTDTTSGAYTVTQLAAIDHPVAGTEDNLQFTVDYEATDGDGDTATGSLSIDVDDDTPIANPVAKSLTETGGGNTNVLLVLDVSGSMGDYSGLTGLDRLDVMKAAVFELLELYEAVGNVRVQIAVFSSNATVASSTWMTVARG